LRKRSPLLRPSALRADDSSNTTDQLQYASPSTSSLLAEAALARGDPPIIKTTIPEDGATLADAVAQAARISPDEARALLRLGAVYLGEYPGGIRGPLKWRRWKERREDEEDQQQQEEERRRRPPPRLAAGTPLRVHVRPKRFSAACAAVRVLDDDVGRDYVVVAKPAGLPSMAHESNGEEHAAPCAERALLAGSSRSGSGANNTPAVSLQLCHRLDTWTSGVLVLARHRDAAARFAEALKGGGGEEEEEEGEKGGGGGGSSAPFTQKTYLALVRGRPEERVLVGWMHDGPWGDRVDVVGGAPLAARGPRLLAAEDPGVVAVGGGGNQPPPDRSWKRCELVIERAELASPSASRWADAAERRARAEIEAAEAVVAGGGDRDGAPSSSSSASPWHQLTIRLITGRTHQIRTQLAAAGHPIAGDSVYGAMPGVVAEWEVAAGGGNGDSDGPRPSGPRVTGAARLRAVRVAGAAVLGGPLGLHAWRLRWRVAAVGEGGVAGGVREHEAPVPWEGGGGGGGGAG
jgi:23S rRNA-/tRNA-specific pseudouridylate synthase